MKQRMSIAVALLHSPSLLILDEPTNGLDPNGIIEMRELLSRLNSEDGVTIVISSHLLAEIEKLVTHVGIIHQGHMVFQGTMKDLKRRQQQILSVCVGTHDDETALKIMAGHVPNARMADGNIVVAAKSNEHIAHINRLLVEGGLDVYEIRAVQQRSGNDLHGSCRGTGHHERRFRSRIPGRVAQEKAESRIVAGCCWQLLHASDRDRCKTGEP